MKRIFIVLTILAVIVTLAWEPVVEKAWALYYPTLVYTSQGGDTLHIKAGGVIDNNGRADTDSATIGVATVTTLMFGTKKLVMTQYQADPNADNVKVAVSGTDADDVVLATLNVEPGNDAYLKTAVAGTDTVQIYFSADPAESVSVSLQVWQD